MFQVNMDAETDKILADIVVHDDGTIALPLHLQGDLQPASSGGQEVQSPSWFQQSSTSTQHLGLQNFMPNGVFHGCTFN